MSPLISVGIPAYNREAILEKCLNSILKQTYKNIEIIVSDNHSTDNTFKICQKISSRDRRVVCFRQKRNIGMGKNFNFVLKKSKGKYFMWVGSDDLLKKNSVELLFKALSSNKKNSLAMGNYENFKFRDKKKISHRNSIGLHSSLSVVNDIKYYFSLKETALIMLYGLYKSADLKKVGGILVDKRPFLEFSDALVPFRVILLGQLVTIPKMVYRKRDTGFFLDKFALAQRKLLNKKIPFYITRHLSLPIFYLYDLILMSYFNFISSFNTITKIRILFLIIWHFISMCVHWLLNSLKGFFYLIKGLL